jgi:ligand-binding sensor domain-containing protein
VDGGNRKWIASANSGIFLLSPDGLEILQHITTENSSLISNNIMDIQFNNKTGELFIVTDKGLVSYRADASYQDEEYSDVQVFPNPVRPEFQGPITIQGIRYDSDVKVTDVAGNLVYQTKSNGGTATWNGKNLQGEPVKSGVYLFWTATNSAENKGRKIGKVLVIR